MRWLAVCALAILAAALLALSPEPQPQLAPLAVIGALLAGWRARRQFALARRAEIGARSEQLVDEMLEPLRLEEWDIHTNVRWPGNGGHRRCRDRAGRSDVRDRDQDTPLHA